MLVLSCILIASWLVGRGYAAYCKRRIAEEERFLSLLLHIEKGITLFLKTPREIADSFSGEEISDLLERVRSGESLGEAFLGVRRRLALSSRMSDRLSEYFSELGTGYREVELKRLALFIGEVREDLAVEEERTPVRIRLAYTLLFAAALSVVIMLL